MPMPQSYRPHIAAGLLLCLLVCAWIGWCGVDAHQNPTPAALTIAERGASGEFAANTSAVAFEADCVRVRWRVEGIRAIFINDSATVGEGERDLCGETPLLTVIFADGSTQSYSLPRAVLIETPLTYAVLLLTALLLALAGWVYGIWARLYRLFLRVSHLCGRGWARLTGWLPRDAVSEGRSVAALYGTALCGLVLLGWALRLHFIDMPITGDEAWTFVDFAAQPLTEGLANYWSTNNHIFHTLLVHLSYRLFGGDVMWVRLPALLFGVLLIPLTYQVGRVYFNRAAGLLAAALMTTSSIFVEYAVQARGYTILLSLVLALLLLAHRLVRFDRRADWLRFGGLTALGFYTMPIMFYPFGAVAAWLGLSLLADEDRARRGHRLRHFAVMLVGAGGLTLLLYSPVIVHRLVVGEARADFEHLETVSVGRMLNDLPGWFTTMWVAEWTRDLPVLIERVLQPLLLLSIVLHGRLSQDRFSLPLVALLTALALLFAYRVVFIPRIWLFGLPLLYIGAAAGAVYLLRRLLRRLRLPQALIFTLLGLSLAVATTPAVLASSRILPHPLAYHVRDLTADLAAYRQPGDHLYITEWYYNIVRYYAFIDGYDLAPIDAFYDEDAPAERLIVVAIDRPQQGIERALNDSRIDDDPYTAPTLAVDGERFDFYTLLRLPAAR
jgi:hypothetical protein